ncbi:MAG: hypothetical protein RL223_1529 [Pseudomonadota bacterium]|jgi:ADP-ribose pyrophosphatase YjhB (NUDIX family)/catechol 2,3-dioxygenase-like lactoylglutathione lyase family enzyme
MNPHLSCITLAVDDLEAAVRFYRDGLGLATDGIVGTQYPNGAVAFFALQDGLKLALWPRTSLATDAGLAVAARSATEVELAHNVASEAEVDALIARARAAGARVIRPAGRVFWGGWAGLFQSPDGHLWEIAHNPNWTLPASASATPPAAPRPEVGVGVLVQAADGRLLLGRRRGAHGAGTWSAPGGKLEFGESVEAAARRELGEETGLAVDHLQPGPWTNDVFDDAGRHFLTAFVLARGVRGEPCNREPDKCEGWHWFDWDALPQPLFAPLASLRASGWRPPAPDAAV